MPGRLTPQQQHVTTPGVNARRLPRQFRSTVDFTIPSPALCNLVTRDAVIAYAPSTNMDGAVSLFVIAVMPPNLLYPRLPSRRSSCAAVRSRLILCYNILTSASPAILNLVGCIFSG